jgi:hypothetical protein
MNCLMMIMESNNKMSIKKYLKIFCDSIIKPTDLGIKFYTTPKSDTHMLDYKVLDEKIYAISRIKYDI